jgi:hypothetical protein
MSSFNPLVEYSAYIAKYEEILLKFQQLNETMFLDKSKDAVYLLLKKDIVVLSNFGATNWEECYAIWDDFNGAKIESALYRFKNSYLALATFYSEYTRTIEKIKSKIQKRKSRTIKQTII